MPRVPDPYAVFKFVIVVGGIEVGGFSEVSGIQAETETEDFREGGVNIFLRKIAKVTKYTNLTLKRGITDADLLWKWHQDVVNGKIEKKLVTVVLQDKLKNEKWRWVFSDAYPVKWSSTDLNATSNTVAVESVEFAHHGIRKG